MLHKHIHLTELHPTITIPPQISVQKSLSSYARTRPKRMESIGEVLQFIAETT
jgi:hypothetical protein